MRSCTFMTQSLQKMLYVWPRKTVQCLEAESSVFCDARATQKFRGASTFCYSNFLSRALQFWNCTIDK